MTASPRRRSPEALPDAPSWAAAKAQSVFDVTGEVVLVTGASSGLGRRFAWVLASNGARVVLTGRQTQALEAHTKAITDQGGAAISVAADLRDDGAITRVFDAAEATFGPVTVAVNNAGIPGPGAVAALPHAQWRAVLSVDLDAAFQVAQQALQRMAPGGSIINISSILGLRASIGDAAYSVAKAGLTQLSAVMALEAAKVGVRVNTIAPGYVVTGMNRAYFDSPECHVLTDRIPMGRVGQVDDLDGAILLLASRASRFMTGAIIVVDGGHIVPI